MDVQYLIVGALILAEVLIGAFVRKPVLRMLMAASCIFVAVRLLDRYSPM